MLASSSVCGEGADRIEGDAGPLGAELEAEAERAAVGARRSPPGGRPRCRPRRATTATIGSPRRPTALHVGPDDDGGRLEVRLADRDVRRRRRRGRPRGPGAGPGRPAAGRTSRPAAASVRLPSVNSRTPGQRQAAEPPREGSRASGRPTSRCRRTSRPRSRRRPGGGSRRRSGGRRSPGRAGSATRIRRRAVAGAARLASRRRRRRGRSGSGCCRATIAKALAPGRGRVPVSSGSTRQRASAVRATPFSRAATTSTAGRSARDRP